VSLWRPRRFPKARGRSSDYPQGKECCGSNARDGRWELYGFTVEEAVGHVSHELLQTVFPEEVAPIEFRLRAAKEWRGRLTHTARDGHVIWAESLWQLRRADLVIEQNTDITERVELERQREVTMLELTHRINNVLTVVQTVARTRFGTTNPEAPKDFDRRLQALGYAKRVLAQGHWERPFLRKIIFEVAQAMQVENRILLKGPRCRAASDRDIRIYIGFSRALHQRAQARLVRGPIG
jgi:hypothetical protein